MIYLQKTIDEPLIYIDFQIVTIIVNTVTSTRTFRISVALANNGKQ